MTRNAHRLHKEVITATFLARKKVQEQHFFFFFVCFKKVNENKKYP